MGVFILWENLGKMTSECTVLRLYNDKSHSQRSRAEDICMRKFSVVTSVCFNWLAACVAVYTKSCLTVFVTPWTVAHQAPLSMRLPKEEYWSGLPFPPPGDFPDSVMESRFPALQADSLPLSHLGSPDSLQDPIWGIGKEICVGISASLMVSWSWLVFGRVSCKFNAWDRMSHINNQRRVKLLFLIKAEVEARRRQWRPTPVLLPGKSHGRRSLVGCRPWGCWGLDTIEWLHFHFSLSYIGEGNGNPLQCFCLENPRDGGAWWAAVYGVTQSRTQLKWLSSSSRSYWLVYTSHHNAWSLVLILLEHCRISSSMLVICCWVRCHPCKLNAYHLTISVE